MSTVSRLAKSSMLVLLTTTLATAAYAGGGGHAGSNGSSGATGPVHANPVHSDARVVAGKGTQTLPQGAVAHGFGGNHTAWSKVIHLPTAPAGANK